MNRRHFFVTLAAAFGAATQASSLKGALSAFVEKLRPVKINPFAAFVTKYYRASALNRLRHNFVFKNNYDIILPQTGQPIRWFRYKKDIR